MDVVAASSWEQPMRPAESTEGKSWCVCAADLAWGWTGLATDGRNVELSHLRPHALSSHFSEGESESKIEEMEGSELRWPGRGSGELLARLHPPARRCPGAQWLE